METGEIEIKERLCEVDIDKILVNPYQPRRHFQQEELEELAASIKTLGLLQPPLVRSLPQSDCYELIAGERRFRASRLAGLQKIPVVIRHASYSVSAEAALVENIQRVDLNPLEVAKALRSLMSDLNYNQDEIAHRIGKKRSTVANYLRLLTLPIAIQDLVASEKISMGHAKAILGLESEFDQKLLCELILRKQLNVRASEAEAARMNKKGQKGERKLATRDFHLEHLAEKIQQRLGTKVSIEGKAKGGRIYIDYYNYDDLDRLLELLGIKGQI